MTTRYELRRTWEAHGNYLDVFIQGAPTSAGCEARVPLRTGREEHCREFAEHIVNLLNADVLEQARRANGAQALQDYAARTGLEGGRAAPPGPGRPDALEERWQQC